jgi:hypothetical protein
MTLPSDLLSLETERSDRQLNVQSVIQCKMGVDFGGTLCKPFRDLKLAALCGELLRVVAPHSALLQGIGLESDHDEQRFSSYSYQTLGTQGNHRIWVGIVYRIGEK